MAAIREREPLNHVESPSDDEEHDGNGEGECSSNEESECDWGALDDSEEDPTFDVVEEARSALSKISLRKSKPKPRKKSEGDREDEPDVVVVNEIPALDAKDRKCFEVVQKLIKDGQLEKLKVDQCKVYLRKNGLRLTGKKDTLIDRIREHLEIQDGGGENKYPISSFVVDCKGDACTGDVVMFEQNVYEMFSIASRSATGLPLGKRLVAGRIVKESYGEAKQQHTFTIEVLWSKGEKPLSPLRQLLIKGRNLYRLKTMRQRWDDEEERTRVLQEKHARGSLARYYRGNRIQEKKMRNKGRLNRTKEKNSSKVAKGQGIHNQGNPCLPDVLQPHRIQDQPLQHHQKTQNSVEIQVTEQATGTHIQMMSSKPTTEYRENSVQQSKLQPGQPPQHSLSLVNSKVLQQLTNIIDIRSESRSKQPPSLEKHSKYPQGGYEQYSSRTDQLLHDHAKQRHHRYQSQQRVSSYDRQSKYPQVYEQYSSRYDQLLHDHAKHHRLRHQSQQRVSSYERQAKYPQGYEQYSSRADQLLHGHAKHHRHRYQSQQRLNSYDRQSKYPQSCEQYSSCTDQLLHDHAKHHHHQYQSQQNSYDRQSFVKVNYPLHPSNRQPCRYYRRGWCYFGEQCKYLHGSSSF